jgi:hypothetical protein
MDGNATAILTSLINTSKILPDFTVILALPCLALPCRYYGLTTRSTAYGFLTFNTYSAFYLYILSFLTVTYFPRKGVLVLPPDKIKHISTTERNKFGGTP